MLPLRPLPLPSRARDAMIGAPHCAPRVAQSLYQDQAVDVVAWAPPQAGFLDQVPLAHAASAAPRAILRAA